MYEWSELIKLWEHDQVTEIQVIGQLLRHGEAQQVQMTVLQRRVAQLEQTLSARGAQTPSTDKPTGARRSEV